MRRVVVVLMLAQAVSAAWAASFSCQALVPPPGEFVHALEIGQELVVADHSSPALWRYDLSSGKQVGRVGKVGRASGEYERPFYLFFTDKGYGVFDGGKSALLYFSQDHRFLEETRFNPDWVPLFLFEAPPAWHGGKIVALGGISGELTGGADGWLFLFAGDKLRTLLPARDNELTQISNAQEGGVCGWESGGFVAVSPMDYRFFVLSAAGELSGSFAGVRERFRPPDWSSLPQDPYDRDGYFSWLSRQAYVSAPQCLAEGKVAVLVRAPGQARVFLEVYRVREGRLASVEEVKVPLKSGEYLLSVAGPRGSFFFSAREKYGAGSPTRLCGAALP